MKRKNKLFLLLFTACAVIISINTLITIQKRPEKNSSRGGNNSIEVSNDVGQKIIYLTFDDGPSSVVAPKLMDILKENNVKATFFVIGSKIKGREEVIKRMYNEGHSIGLHTFTHKQNLIYMNNNSFIDEMAKTSSEIKRAIGIEPKILRFPWGSYKHLNPELLNSLHSLGYKIYDWNAEVTDGINPDTPSGKLVRQAEQSGYKKDTIILLMHCDHTNKNTCDALPQIIKYYKDLGYEFKTITEDTPEYYARIKRKK